MKARAQGLRPLRFYILKNHAERHKEENEHLEDGTYRSYAVDVHLPKEK